MCCQIASSLHTLNPLTRGYSASSLAVLHLFSGQHTLFNCLLFIGDRRPTGDLIVVTSGDRLLSGQVERMAVTD